MQFTENAEYANFLVGLAAQKTHAICECFLREALIAVVGTSLECVGFKKIEK